MAVTNIPPIILHGVGKSTLIYGDGSMLSIPKSKNIQVEVKGDMGEQVGGDGLFPLMKFLTKKSGTVSIEDATFSLEQAKFTQGGTLVEGASVNKEEEVTASAGAATLSVTTGIDVDSVVVVDKTTGKAMKRVESSPAAGQFTVTSAGALAFESTFADTVTVNYFYKAADGVNLSVMNDSLAQPCELRHTIVTDEQADGKRYKLTLRVYRCRNNGNFTYDAKRGEAFSPKVEFEIEDAGREDGKTMEYSVVPFEA